MFVVEVRAGLRCAARASMWKRITVRTSFLWTQLDRRASGAGTSDLEGFFLRMTYQRNTEGVTSFCLLETVCTPVMPPRGLPLYFLVEAIREAGDRLVKRPPAGFHFVVAIGCSISRTGRAVRSTPCHGRRRRQASATCGGSGWRTRSMNREHVCAAPSACGLRASSGMVRRTSFTYHGSAIALGRCRLRWTVGAPRLGT